MSRTPGATTGLGPQVSRFLRRLGGVLAGTATLYAATVAAVFLAELLRALADELDWEDGD